MVITAAEKIYITKKPGSTNSTASINGPNNKAAPINNRSNHFPKSGKKLLIFIVSVLSIHPH